ncbi:VOC family protein [Shewanella intestini]|uniref:VOC family protein n=1 Tax=Shewanella intestini TaxID=2017544 RepID=A0ABS5I676_9GAMM|nr:MULTISPECIES: VOC family protein [Shewanella]MBR9729512.1 VOC family protein [Shewanella intestini]MRG37559.1 VOC family protein [Shewanella sp. XMDDZSB0408]
MNYQTLQRTWPEFNQQILAMMKQLGLDALKLECDHAALRVNHVEFAEQLCNEFAEHGEVISSNIINGRPILIIKLNQPMPLGEQSIACVELPYPANKNYPVEGWEHIELVFPTPAQNCEQLAKALITQIPSLESVINGETDINVKMSSPKGDNERISNPTIAFKLGNICIKVHPHSIETIIKSETNSR